MKLGNLKSTIKNITIKNIKAWFIAQGEPRKPFSVREGHTEESGRKPMRVIKKGPAMRVIFFYPGEEGTYVDHAEVTLYENGIVHIDSTQEETTTHLQNCEILWRFETDADERQSKVRLLRPSPKNPEKFEPEKFE